MFISGYHFYWVSFQLQTEDPVSLELFLQLATQTCNLGMRMKNLRYSYMMLPSAIDAMIIIMLSRNVMQMENINFSMVLGAI